MKRGDWVDVNSVGHTTVDSARESRDAYQKALPDIRFRVRYSAWGYYVVQRYQPR